MRRAIASFTVEVRRRPRLATASQCVQRSETKIPQTGVERESLPVAAAALEAERSNQILIEAVASRPKGRILWSLVPEAPNASLSVSTLDPTSCAQKRPQVRALKGRDQTSRSWRNFGSSSERVAPLVDNLSTASCRSYGAPQDERTGLSPSEPTAAPSQVAGNGGRLAPRSKAKQRDKMPTPLDDSRATHSLEDQRYRTGTDSPSVDEGSRQSRRRTIMGRYVFGDELKPGERWKRRLLNDP